MKRSKLVAPMADTAELYVPQTALSLRQQRNLVQFAAAMCFQTWKEAYDNSKVYARPHDPEQLAYMKRITLQQLEQVVRAVDEQLNTFPPQVKKLYEQHQQEYMDGNENKELKPVN